jgi:hypothetical protein
LRFVAVLEGHIVCTCYFKRCSGDFSNVAEEEIAKQFPTERREMIFCAIPMTEKWPFLHMMTEKRQFWFWMYTGDNIFFSVGNQFFLFNNFNTTTHCMAHIKIIFLINFFDRVPQLPAFNGSGY